MSPPSSHRSVGLGRLLIAVLAGVEVAPSALPVSVDGGLRFPLRKVLQERHKNTLLYTDYNISLAGRTTVFALDNTVKMIFLKLWSSISAKK